jgi:hypothetical protein
MFVLVHHDKARTLEQSVVTRRRTRECAGVREGRLGAALTGADLVDHHRLARLARDVSGLDQPARIGHAFEHAGNGVAVGVFGQVGDLVGSVHVATIARGEHVAEGHAALHRLRHAHAQRARLADEANGAAARQPQAHGDVGEGAERAVDGVHHAQAIGAKQAGARVPSHLHNVALDGLVLGVAALAEARGEDDDTAHTQPHALLDDRLDRISRHGNKHAVGHLGQRRERGKTRASINLLVLGVDQMV